jgi:hypothetical protein
MSPYFRDEDIPEPACEGSFVAFNWEGAWDDPARPKEFVCPVCGVTLRLEYEQYEIDEKKGLVFACVPVHYPHESP